MNGQETLPAAAERDATDTAGAGAHKQAERGAGVTAFLTLADVAAELQCSHRTVYRLADRGKIPRPLKLGGLVRWPRAVFAAWLEKGCPACRG